MRDKADLTDRYERLEHIVMQLQGETDTIGESVCLSVCLSVLLSVCVSFCLCVCHSVSGSVSWSIVGSLEFIMKAASC